jgi:hypothetical protein
MCLTYKKNSFLHLHSTVIYIYESMTTKGQRGNTEQKDSVI